MSLSRPSSRDRIDSTTADRETILSVGSTVTSTIPDSRARTNRPQCSVLVRTVRFSVGYRSLATNTTHAFYIVTGLSPRGTQPLQPPIVGPAASSSPGCADRCPANYLDAAAHSTGRQRATASLECGRRRDRRISTDGRNWIDCRPTGVVQPRTDFPIRTTSWRFRSTPSRRTLRGLASER